MRSFLIYWLFVTLFFLLLVEGPDYVAYVTHNKDLATDGVYTGLNGFYRSLVAAPIAGALVTAVIFLTREYSRRRSGIRPAGPESARGDEADREADDRGE